MRKNLIMWEIENGYKAKWVADKLGISRASWFKIKRGKANPSIELAYRFNEAFPEEDVLELFKNIQ